MLLILLLASRKVVPGYVAGAAVLICLLLAVSNLGRPDGAWRGFSSEAFGRNLDGLLSGYDARVLETEDGRILEPESLRPVRLDQGDIFAADRRTPWPVAVLVGALAVCLIATAFRGFIRYGEGPLILSAGAMSAIVGVTALALLGHCLGHIGVGLTVSVLAAVAAASGDFEEELVED